jgi:hypothetical protein
MTSTLCSPRDAPTGRQLLGAPTLLIALITVCSLAACGARTNLGSAQDAGPRRDVLPRASHDLSIVPDQALPSPDTGVPACRYERKTEGTLVNTAKDSTSTPSVGYAAETFGVVWLRSSGGGHPVVRMRRLDARGKLLGAETTAGPESHAWAEIGGDGQRLGLCWHTDAGSKSRAAFRTISADGKLGVAHDLDLYSSCYDVQPAAGAAGWVVLLRGYGSQVGSDKTFRYAVARLDSVGKLLAKPTPVLDAASSQRVAVGQRGAKAFVAYVTSDTGNSFARVVIAGVGEGAPPTPLAGSGKDGDAKQPRLVAHRGELYALYSEQQILEPAPATIRQVVYLQRLDASGQALGQRMAITAVDRETALHDVGSDGASLLALTVERETLQTGSRGPSPVRSTLRVLTLDGSGKQQDPPLSIHQLIEAKPTLSYGRLAIDRAGRRALAVWNQSQNPGNNRYVYAAAVGCGL